MTNIEQENADGDKIIKKILSSGECHFTKDQAAVCSPIHIVDKMKEYVEKKGVKVNKPEEVVSRMKELLDCNSESCVLRRPDFVKFAKLNGAVLEEILDKNFKPEGPATNFGLLSNFNIDDILDQFEKRFADRKFLHIPFQMRDFEKVGTQLARVDLAQKFREGYKTFGVVLNTDISSGRGIHWYCIFGKYYGDRVVLEYFNSSGRQPLAETQAWLNKTMHHIEKEMKIPVTIWYSTNIEFQYDDHSCGVYSVAYIWLRLEGVKPSWFKSENFNDDLMHKLRRNIFRLQV